MIDREGTVRYAFIEPNPGGFQGTALELEALAPIEGGGTL